jgi:hypothetical protein
VTGGTSGVPERQAATRSRSENALGSNMAPRGEKMAKLLETPVALPVG